MRLDGQQWVFKNISFSGTTTGVNAGGTDIVFLGCRFENGVVGINAARTSGSLTVIDSVGSGLQAFITSADSGTAANSIILENVQNDGTTVNFSGNRVLKVNVNGTWVHGDLVSCISFQACVRLT